MARVDKYRRRSICVQLHADDYALLPEPLYAADRFAGGGINAFVREAIREKAARDAKKLARQQSEVQDGEE